MRYSLILRTAIRLTFPLLVIVSLFFLSRGHNLPGGGFIGGLVLAAGFSLYSLSFGPTQARRRMLLPPLTWIAFGLLLAAFSGIFAAIRGLPFFKGLWFSAAVPIFGKFGTPVSFDIGVFLLVVGMTMQILILLEEN